ncbi:MAG: hypothetical protein HKN85_04595 [Gammaproteobacteria bacterium]|nr:hypothetical protein [Gammaproteobacteria bacterium]
MKKLVKVLLWLAGIIVLGLAAIFYFTAPLTKSADEFFQAVKDNDMDKAYNYLSADFQAASSKTDLLEFLSANSITQFKEANWDARSISGGRGKLTGSIQTNTGGVVPIALEFVKADDGWKIYAIKKPLAGIQPESSSGQLPEENEQIKLVNDAMLVFVDCVSTQDMSGFHHHISNLWKQQYSVTDLEDAFRQFYEIGADLKILQNYSPIFDQQPAINAEGVLTISGYYPTEPSQVHFTQKFIVEGLNWKLVSFSVDVR